MVRITNSERAELERVGLFRHKRTGVNACDPSFYVANKEHLGRNKHTYIVEDPNVMKFLGRYDGLNLQRINKKQFDSLMDAKLISEETIQRWGDYNPKAICYQNHNGDYRIVKITALMLHLGLWKDNKRKRMAKMAKYEAQRAELDSYEAQRAETESVFGFENTFNKEYSCDFHEETEVPASSDLPDINEQAKELGMPQFIFRDVDTGEIVRSGSADDLKAILGGNLSSYVTAQGVSAEEIMD